MPYTQQRRQQQQKTSSAVKVTGFEVLLFYFIYVHDLDVT
jgi:hypothetical protein